MKKFYMVLMVILASVIFTACVKDNDGLPGTIPPGSGDKVQLLSHNHFESGFNLLGINPAVDGREVKKYLDYNGEAIERPSNPWVMGQWWTPYNVVDAVFTKKNDIYSYKTPSRTININPQDNGYLNFDLLGSKEYDEPRQMNQPWTHLLIEQDFTNSVKLSQLSSLVMSMEVTINKADNMMGKDYDPNLHAAQLLWYLIIRNVLPEDYEGDDLGENGDFLWFGTPIYDNRSDFIPQSAHIDTGAEGTTGKLIYSMSSKKYINEKIKIGKTYNIKIDVLPYIRESFVYAVSKGLLPGVKFENMEVGYMNFGWELPGTFDVNSTIRNISIEGELA